MENCLHTIVTYKKKPQGFLTIPITDSLYGALLASEAECREILEQNLPYPPAKVSMCIFGPKNKNPKVPKWFADCNGKLLF